MIPTCKIYTFCIIIFRYFTRLKYMRARFFAVFILFILVLLPVSVYMYFTTQKIATFTITASPGVDFSAQLVWSFGIDGLPLANKMLSYQKNCTDRCVFSPVLPAHYTLTITASGKTTLSDVVIVNSWDQVTRSYIFHDDITLTPMGNITRDESLSMSLIENARAQQWWEYSSIGTDIRNRTWVLKQWEENSQIWILTTEKFTPIRNINTQILSASIDASRSVLILNLVGSKTLLLTIDLSLEKEITTMASTQIVSIIPGDVWKIQTNTGTLEIKWERLIEDIRFTNSIDISPRIRIGYISKIDTKKLSLANLPITDSVLIQIDRSKGDSVILRRGLEIQSMFFYNKKPAYIDTSGNIYTIDL